MSKLLNIKKKIIIQTLYLLLFFTKKKNQRIYPLLFIYINS
jgi:hypothetical protein